MGLDVSIRYRRVNSQPIGIDNWGHQIYQDFDTVTGECEFNGRYEFSCIRDWVGDERYADYITLDSTNLHELKAVIERELLNRGTAYNLNECPLWLESSYTEWGLAQLYKVICLAPIFEAHGWYMEIECDW